MNELNNEDKQTRHIKCPTCKTETVWDTANSYRPFCSQRCRETDFIQWANEEQVLAGQPVYDDLMSEELNRH